MRLTNMDGARGRVALRAGCSGIVLFLWLLLSVRRGRVGRHAAGDGQYDELPGLAATLPPLSFFCLARARARETKKIKIGVADPADDVFAAEFLQIIPGMAGAILAWALFTECAHASGDLGGSEAVG